MESDDSEPVQAGPGNVITVCAGCRRLHDEHGSWRYMTAAEREDPSMGFSHGLCPDCVERLYPSYSRSHEKEGPYASEGGE